MQLAMIADKIMPFEELDAVYLDRGFYFGDGVYEVIRSYNGKIFAIEDHLQRFANSLAAINIEGVAIDAVRKSVTKAFEQAGIANARIYFHITRGSAPRSHIWDDDIKANFFLTVTELSSSTETKTNGISVSTFPDWRWKRCDIKSLNLLANVLARQDANKKGCDEAVLINEKGLITEGAGSTFFAIISGKLQTTPLSGNILPSITRKYVLKAAKSLSILTVEEFISPEQAKKADELFIAVTTKDIIPVVKFDEVVIGDGKPGRHTKELSKKFMEYTK
jgi:D-alanine transaminase